MIPDLDRVSHEHRSMDPVAMPPVSLQARQSEEFPAHLLPAELAFYQEYDWCLDAFPTVRSGIAFLRREISRLNTPREEWQVAEVATNVFLLSCALLNAADGYLRGSTLRMPKRLAGSRFGRAARLISDILQDALQWPHRRPVRRWRRRWEGALEEFLSVMIASQSSLDPDVLATSATEMGAILEAQLPARLQETYISVPSPFRRLDLTHFDVLALGRQLVTHLDDPLQPILILGLRTSGSYFGPLLKAFLKAQGFRAVSMVTVQPDKAPGRWERKEIDKRAREGYTAVIVDDPPHTGSTVLLALEIASRLGFSRDKLRVLAPTYPVNRNWSEFLPHNLAISLEPEQWHKRRLLDPKLVERQLAEYFQYRKYSSVTVIANSSGAEQFNARLWS